jgi:flavin-dependent dehydrogenase
LIPKQPRALERHLRGQFQEAFATTPVFGGVDDSSASWCIRDARTTCRRRLWRGRWLPIGDAAFAVDPISGAGLTRSIEMAISAAECVAEFLKTGCTKAIQRFATLNTLAFTESLSVLRQVYATRMDSNRPHPFWQRRANPAAFMKPI